MFGKKKVKPEEVVIDNENGNSEEEKDTDGGKRRPSLITRKIKTPFRMLPWYKKAGIIVLLVLIFYVVSSLAFSPVMYKILFKRSEMPQYTTEMNYSMVDSSKYPRNAVAFSSGKNVLSGVVYKAQNPKGTIILVNGQNAGIDTHLAEIMYFVDHNFNVFTYDATGVRTSSGKSQRGLSQAAVDVKNAIKFIQNSEFKDENLFLYGHSLGGLGSGASLKRKTDVDAAVLIASLESPIRTMFDTAKHYAGPVVYPEYPFLCLQDFFVFGANSNVSAIKGINRSKIPVMIVEGANDTTISEETSLYAHRDRIKNDKVVYVYIDEEYRDEHSTAWLSKNAAKLKLSEESILSALKKSNKKGIPESDYNNFLNTLDYDEMYELDEDFMMSIVQFYEDSVK